MPRHKTRELILSRDACIALVESKGVAYRGFADLQRHLRAHEVFLRYMVERAEFAQQNIGLVHFIVKRHFRHQEDNFGYEDLVHEGLLGILRAIDLYQLDVGKFSTYAVWWIRQNVQRALENKLRIVRIPTHQIARVAKLKRQLRMFGALDLDDSEYMQKMLPQMVCVAPGQESFENRSITYDLDARLHITLHLGILDDRELYIVRCRFGFGCAPYSLGEIGEDLGITGERVRQIEERALEKLREALQ